MKKAILIILLGTGFFAYAQETENTEEATENEIAKHEIKVNAAYLLGGIPEIYYERILNEESAVGISVAVPLESDITLNFLVIPYYRFYFGKKRAAGFFIEGNAAVFSEEVRYDGFFDDESVMDKEGENKMGMGFGIALGGKWLTRSNWLVEITGGVGRNFVNEDVISEAYPRFGITVGKRF